MKRNVPWLVYSRRLSGVATESLLQFEQVEQVSEVGALWPRRCMSIWHKLNRQWVLVTFLFADLGVIFLLAQGPVSDKKKKKSDKAERKKMRTQVYQRKLNTAIRSDGSGLMKEKKISDSRGVGQSDTGLNMNRKREVRGSSVHNWGRPVGLRGGPLNFFFFFSWKEKKKCASEGFIVFQGMERWREEGRRLGLGPCVYVCACVALRDWCLFVCRPYSVSLVRG